MVWATGGDSFRGLCGSGRDNIRCKRNDNVKPNSNIYLVRCHCRHLPVSVSFSSFLVRQRHFGRVVNIKLSIHDIKAHDLRGSSDDLEDEPGSELIG